MTHYSEAIIQKYAVNVPRYTSYPTAPHFNHSVGQEDYCRWLGEMEPETGISIYIHIPFCDRLCWFCGCHTKHTLKYQPVRNYLAVLYKEIELVGELIGKYARVNQLHLGGGSPSMLKSEDLHDLKASLSSNFRFIDDAQISIELDPSDLVENQLDGFANFGMNRASIGVQDFSDDVQKAINRPQSFEDTQFVVGRLRKTGINSLNIDALYGLPLQTAAGLRDTLGQVVSLNPDRIALFGYAHVPWMKKHQQMIDESTIPDIRTRFTQARMAEDFLRQSGYLQIGIDHFALPGDSLAVAMKDKKLRRNFQGYTTDDSKFLIGLGASSIGKTPAGFVQNTHATANYMKQVECGELPIFRGRSISTADKLRSGVIEQLMCNFEISFEWLEENANPGNSAEIDKIHDIARQLAADSRDGYFTQSKNGYMISCEGRPFTRQFAACFDEYLKQNSARYSVAV
jgi:oxygen-independent coproporphyrinogen-3 oxidase